jgi:hypothetical protein
VVQSHAKTVGSVFVKVFGGEGKTFVSPIGFYLVVSIEFRVKAAQKSGGKSKNEENLVLIPI